ncbi:MFS transporter [Streptomyces asoensis]|uniref:MFS transporter n=1 Tax=Streptomyces asoensis TaxID=249586 RepID=A0A6M4WKZ0_9ACTN|nr:MFS transporter [Streptomyces asoensis]QJS99854.1 MFS transporter [Streptomyces asoensis]
MHTSSATATAPAPHPHRWKALVFIAIAQLMIVLDATVVNIALPHAQEALHISDGNRQWLITAYSLTFGGLLLFGGRIGDLWGRRRAFLTGLIGFALASALGGAAVNTGMLLGARALQGVFGALLAPAALSLLTVTFTEAKERATAFGIFSSIAVSGGAIGLILGGALTQYVDWRWCMYVNIVFAVVAAVGAAVYVRDRDEERNRDRLDIPGALMATAGLVTLVYGFTKAEEAGWRAATTIGLLLAAVFFLAAFVLVESRTKAPLLPLRVVADRNRGGAYLAIGLAMIGMFGQFLLLTYYFQLVKGYSPVLCGIAFLPLVTCLVIGSTQIGARLVNRVPGRLLMGPGILLAALGMLLLTRLTADSSYWSHVLPSEIMLGLGMGIASMAGISQATSGVRPQDAGVAGAMVNTSQQVGGSIGTALLNTIAAGATTGWLAAHAVAGATPASAAQQAAVHGYTVAYAWSAGVMALAALIAFVLVNAGGFGSGSGETSAADAGQEADVPVAAH